MNPVNIDRATALLLRRIRNAGHGLASALEDDRDMSVLTAHSGEVPGAVSDIAFLHLVHLLANPAPMKARFARQAGTEA